MTSFTHATTTISQGTSFCAVGCNVAMNAADNPTIGYDVFEAIGAAEGTPTTSLCGYALANTISTSECSTVYINTFCAGGKSSTACFSSVPPVTSVSSASSTITSTSLGSPTASSSIRAASFGSQSSSSPFSGNATAPHNKAGVSAGAAAGIGIGAAIAGAILAALVLLLLAALRKKRRHETAAYGSRLPRHNPDIAGEPKRLSSIMKGGGLVVERDLPQPAEDDAINGELSRLRDKIKDHVQSFYHTQPVSPRAIDLSLLSGVAAVTGIDIGSLGELISNPQSRIATLRLSLAWTILSRCVGQAMPDGSLLPDEVAAFSASVAGTKYTDPNKIALVSKWRVISGALLQSRGAQQQLETTQLEHNIGETVAAANQILAPFVGVESGTSSEKRLRNLESLVRRAAQLALLLFSQPSSWDLDWKSGAVGIPQDSIVVFPGLMETVNEEGVALQPPRQFHQTEVIAVL